MRLGKTREKLDDRQEVIGKKKLNVTKPLRYCCVSISPPSTMSYPCQAEDSDGDECDCGGFAPRANDPKLCRRCLHKQKHHPKSDETISSILTQVKKEREGEPGSKFFDRLTEAKRESGEGLRPKKGTKLSSRVRNGSRSSPFYPALLKIIHRTCSLQLNRARRQRRRKTKNRPLLQLSRSMPSSSLLLG